jgi:hypothetical protein
LSSSSIQGEDNEKKFGNKSTIKVQMETVTVTDLNGNNEEK